MITMDNIDSKILLAQAALRNSYTHFQAVKNMNTLSRLCKLRRTLIANETIKVNV